MQSFFSRVPEELLRHVLFSYFTIQDFSVLDRAIPPAKELRSNFLSALKGSCVLNDFEYFDESVATWSLNRQINFSSLLLNPSAEVNFFFDFASCQSGTLERIDFQRHLSVSDIALVLMTLHLFPCLKYINFDGCVSVTDSGLSTLLEQCPSLKKLTLCDCTNITDLSLEKLSQSSSCNFIASLNINGCWYVTDAGVINVIETCPHLTFLDVSFCSNITDKALLKIAECCTELAHLALQECTKITIDGLAGLTITGKLLQLSDLNLSYCGGCVTDIIIARLSDSHSNLHALNLSNCSEVTDSSLFGISLHCHQLHVLSLFNCSEISDIGVIALTENCLYLEWLDLFNCSQITDASLKALSDHCKNLTHLNVSSCKLVTDKGLLHLSTGSGRDSLTYLNLSYCNVTSSGVHRLTEGCKNIKTLNLFKCKYVQDAGLQALFA